MGFEAINLRRFILAKRAKKTPTTSVVGDFFIAAIGIRTNLNAARMSAAGEGSTERNLD